MKRPAKPGPDGLIRIGKKRVRVYTVQQYAGVLARQHRYTDKHRERLTATLRGKYQRNRDVELARARNREAARRLQCLLHYSGATPVCACCGDANYAFLTIDHIEGGGNRHSQERKKNGEHQNLYTWLIANEFPVGFRVLCYNCNCARGNYGYCPHQRPKTGVA